MTPEILVSFLATLALADGEGPTAYRVAVDGTTRIRSDVGAVVVRRTQAEVDYRVARSGNDLDLSIDRVAMKVSSDGAEVDFLDVGRSRIVSRRPGLPMDVRRADAPPGLRPVFAQFDRPVARIKVGPDGSETSRQVDDAGPLAEVRVVDLARAFHPRFPKGEARWEAPIAIPFGRGQVAEGTIRYAVRPSKPGEPGPKPGDPVDVGLTGFLKVTGRFDRAEVRRGAWKAGGSAVYDPTLRDWTAGTLTVAASFDATTDDGRTFSGEGPVVLTLTRRRAQDKARARPDR